MAKIIDFEKRKEEKSKEPKNILDSLESAENLQFFFSVENSRYIYLLLTSEDPMVRMDSVQYIKELPALAYCFENETDEKIRREIGLEILWLLCQELNFKI